MIKEELPVGAEFKYRNQKYIVTKSIQAFPCDACEEVNAQYIKDNPCKCVAMTKTGTSKFSCSGKCGPFGYPKRIK